MKKENMDTVWHSAQNCPSGYRVPQVQVKLYFWLISVIKDKLFSEVKMEELNVAGGYDKFKEFLDGIFKKNDLTDMYEKLIQFIKYRRGEKEAYVLRV